MDAGKEFDLEDLGEKISILKMNVVLLVALTVVVSIASGSPADDHPTHSTSPRTGPRGAEHGKEGLPFGEVQQAQMVTRKEAKRKRGSGSRQYRTIVVEGNIGSGKSSFLEHFQKFENVKVFFEPVDKWRNLVGHNLLQLMYENARQWSFAFQTYVAISLLHQHQSTEGIKSGDTKIMERSIFTAHRVFTENAAQNGNLNPVKYAILDQAFHWTVTTQPDIVNIDAIVYLRTKPETCYERIAKRGRPEERNVPLAYLQQLHQLHESWLIEERYPVPAEVIVVEADDDWETMRKKYDELATKIM